MRTNVFDIVKRILDVLLAGLGLIVLSPVLAGVAVAVAAKLGRPILFVQPRPGLHGEIFRLRKFRTMLNPAPDGNVASDEERLTSFGRFLRSTSLDELPTLTNVLKGDMSIIGPRPLLVRYLDMYSLEEARRHEVRPGITGLAQVKGRNTLSWTEKFNYDLEYVNNRNALLDLKIIWWTFVTVLRRDGISAQNHVTMPEFKGSAKRPEVQS